MPIANGDGAVNGKPVQRNGEPLDHRKAIEILETEYPSRDGLDIQTLLDSSKNGALTYNDFLILPGYIGTLLLLRFVALHLTDAQALPHLR